MDSNVNASLCQVYCSDGSCRDRQQNCPLIIACNNPLKPYRCKSGICAQSKVACITLYGAEMENEIANLPSKTC